MVIQKREGVVGGKPAIAGTRIKVSHLVLRYFGAGERVSEIVRRYPHITPAQVHTAIAYFYEHPEEILGELYDELHLIDSALTEDDRRRLHSQLAMLTLEGYQFSEIIETPEQAREASGVYLLLREVAKSEYQILSVGAAQSVRAALQNATDSADCYAVRYTPLETAETIANQIRQWLS